MEVKRFIFLARSLVTLVLHPHPNSRSRTEPDVTDAIGVAGDETGDGGEWDIGASEQTPGDVLCALAPS